MASQPLQDLPLQNCQCPRCAYDLTGFTQSWTESCPLYATCPECGLTFGWADIYCLRFPTKGVESFAPFARGLLQSYAGIWRPWRFWNEMRLEHPFKPGHLVFFAVLGFILSYVLTACVLALPIAAQAVRMPRYFDWDDLLLALWPYSTSLYIGIKVDAWEAFVMIWVLLVPPLVPLIIPYTMRRARLRPMHILRGMLYGFATLPILWAAGALYQMITGLLAAPFGTMYTPWGTTTFGPTSLHDLRWIALFLTCGLAQCLWWSAFTGTYLRLPHARGIALAAITISMLITLCIALAFQGWRGELLDPFL